VGTMKDWDGIELESQSSELQWSKQISYPNTKKP